MKKKVKKGLTVRELIQELQKLPEEYQDCVVTVSYDAGACIVNDLELEPDVNGFLWLIGD